MRVSRHENRQERVKRTSSSAVFPMCGLALHWFQRMTWAPQRAKGLTVMYVVPEKSETRKQAEERQVTDAPATEMTKPSGDRRKNDRWRIPQKNSLFSRHTEDLARPLASGTVSPGDFSPDQGRERTAQSKMVRIGTAWDQNMKAIQVRPCSQQSSRPVHSCRRSYSTIHSQPSAFGCGFFLQSSQGVKHVWNGPFISHDELVHM